MQYFDIDSKQISGIHNGMCDLRRAMYECNELFKDDSPINESLKRAFDQLEPIRMHLMNLKDAENDRIRNMADSIASANKFKYTIWSIYEMGSFNDISSVPEGSTLVAPWETEHSVVVEGPTWLDLWRAVEQLADSVERHGYRGFGDHAFIEDFREVKPNVYEVILGS